MNDNDKLWICLYAYKGHETEGALYQEEKFICLAASASEALWKYHFWLRLRSNNKISMVWPSIEEYQKEYYASGGWGYFAYQLDISEIDKRDDKDSFYKEYDLLPKSKINQQGNNN